MKMATLIDQGLKKKKRQEVIKEAEITLIRINPDKEVFDIFDEIREIQDFIYESGKKLAEQSTKNSLIEDSEKMTKMLKQLCV